MLHFETVSPDTLGLLRRICQDTEEQSDPEAFRDYGEPPTCEVVDKGVAFSGIFYQWQKPETARC